MSEGTVLYFGYGTSKVLRMVGAITGAEDLVGKPATLKGYGLFVQRFDQIPDIVLKTAPASFSPRQNIADNWPNTFESYVIRHDSENEVVGTLWELTPEQRELIKDWELVEFGWYQDTSVEVQTEDGQKVRVQTEILGEGQEVDRQVDGKDYNPWLMSPEEMIRIAERSRLEYFKRMSESQEGSPKPPEIQ